MKTPDQMEDDMITRDILIHNSGWRKYRVTIDLVALDMPEENLFDYVQDAVSQWGGQLRPPGGSRDHDPGDPLFVGMVRKLKVKISKGRRKLDEPPEDN